MKNLEKDTPPTMKKIDFRVGFYEALFKLASFFFHQFFVVFFGRSGASLAPQDASRWRLDAPKRLQDEPKSAQDVPKCAQDALNINFSSDFNK